MSTTNAISNLGAIDVERSLVDQGLAHEAIAELLRSVRREFDVDIALDDFLREPTLQHLSGLLAAPRGDASALVAQLVQLAVDGGHAAPDPERDLFEQGYTSLALLDLVGRVRQRYGANVDIETFLRTPTLAHLARQIVPAAATPAAAASVDARLALLRDAARELLGGDDVDPDADLFEQGLTSLAVLGLAQKARQAFGVDIGVDALLARPTLRHLLELAGTPIAVPETPASVSTSAALGLLASKDDKQAFLRRRLNLRDAATTIAGPPRDAARADADYARRRSRRDFAPAPLPADALLAWLGCLAASEAGGDLRYPYPSAGGTYCVQIHVAVRPGAVDGVPAGVYYYHPVRHALCLLGTRQPPAEAHFFYNRATANAAGVMLFLVAERRGIEPIYAGQAEFFVAVEAGAMLQRLAERQADHGIGSCVLSGVDDAMVRGDLQLTDSQYTLLAVAAGPVADATAAVGTADVEAADVEAADIEAAAPAATQDVAIVGLSGRFPGANDLDAYWDGLIAQRSNFSTTPAARWNAGASPQHDLAGYLDAAAAPDAEGLDAQEQVFLGCVHDLVGERAASLPRRTGVFVGVMWKPEAADVDAPRAPFSALPNRVSHRYDWHGPSLAIDTSCASSLTAIHLACRSLAHGDCDAAIAGGVNVFGSAAHLANLRRLNLLGDAPATDTFGDAARGWIAGEGAGAVLLKPLARAQADGDAILGVIRGSALAAAGRVARFGMPSIERQAALMRDALLAARVDADAIDYVEAAAAGSAMGDASEIRALQQVFAARTRPLPVGSVKPNIGHLESASGLSQLAKVLLQFRHERVAPTIAPGRLNPLIDLSSGCVRLATDADAWPAPRVALINGFGGTGAYASLVVTAPDAALRARAAPDEAAQPIVEPAPDVPAANAALLDFLTTTAARLLGAPPDVALRSRSLFDLGLTSADVVAFVREVALATGCTLSPSLVFEAPDLTRIAAHLAQQGATIREPDVATPCVNAPGEDATHADATPSGFALSQGQAGLWALQRGEPASSAYNCPLVLALRQRIAPDALTVALQALAAAHPVLTTRIAERDGVPLQRFDAAQIPALHVEAAQADLAAATALAADCAKRPFALDAALWRAHLIPLAGDGGSVVALVAHHLVCDGRSFPLLIETLLAALRGEKVAPGRSRYAAFVADEHARIDGDDGARRVAWWREHLAEPPPPLNLPLDTARGAARSIRGATFAARLPRADGDAVRALAQETAIYPSTLLLGAFGLFLRQYAVQDDIVVGMPVDARPRNIADAAQVGYYVDVLPLRLACEPGMPCDDWLRGVQRTLLASMTHALPFPALVRALKIRPEPGRQPLFQVAFAYQNYADAGAIAALLDGGVAHIDAISQEGEFELMLEVVDRGGEIALNWKYDAGLWSAASVERMHGHFCTLLQSILARPDAPAGSLSMLAAAERRVVIEAWNATARARGTDATLHGLFERQARATPDAIATGDAQRQLSYAELDRRANRLAHALIRRGTRRGDRIGVCMERSVDLIVALLGILKAGAAYVPIDPDYPAERRRFMLDETAGPVVLAQDRLRDLLADYAERVLCVDGDAFAQESADAPDVALAGDDLAYVIYTSGSTGRPKGCLLTHAAICNRLTWMQDEYRLDAGDVVLQKTPYSFDVSVWEFFWPLLAGARQVFADPGGHKDPAYLIRLIETQGVTTCHFVPSMLAAFLGVARRGRCASLKRVFASGEALPYALCERFRETFDAGLHNLYGPTEAAVDVTYWEYAPRADAKVPIGRPIANIQIYILQPSGEPAPIGVPGELHIGGVGLARGYLERPELTREKFIADPFSIDARARLYKTGDVARWLPDGTIEYLGRVDHQVKLRGFRIELGEIEAALLAENAVREAVALVRADGGGDPQLVAYVVANADHTIDAAALRASVKNRLPEHMVPARIVVLPQFPLTQSGKLDRKALPAPGAATAAEAYVAPQGETETALAAIWQELLGVARVGRHDDFFELGGHSLKAIALLTRAAQACGGREVAQVDFYRRPTLAGLAELLAQGTPGARERLPHIARGNAATRLTLVCVPYAGASATVFQAFADALCARDPALAVRAVALPGNEFGSAPEGYVSVEQMAEACADELAAQTDGPLAVYGHCIGSFLALELTRQLERRGRRVEFLAVGAAFPFPRLVRWLPYSDPWRFTGDAKLHALIKRWGGPDDAVAPEVVRFMLRNFRKDARLAFQYEQNRTKWTIAAPILCIVSDDDELTRGYRRKYRAWSALSADVSLAVIGEGRHYFVGTRAADVAAIVGDYATHRATRE